MFIALDKLFALHNALLLESRLIKAFFLYSVSMFVLYMFTSTKQTYTVRHRLYIGMHSIILLCRSFSHLMESSYVILNMFYCHNLRFSLNPKTLEN